MKLGFVSAILPDLSLESILAFAGAEGFDCVELMCWPVSTADRRYAGVTHVDVSDSSSSFARDIEAMTAAANVGISALGYYPNPLAPDPTEARTCIDHLKRVIEAAARLDVRLVNTFVGRDRHRTIDQNWPRLLETWRPLVAFAEDHDVRIAIENCPMLYTDNEWPGGDNLAYAPAIWRRLFQDIESEALGLNYDPSHLIWQQIDEVKPITEFADRLFHVHIKDARVDHEKLADVGTLATPLSYHEPKLPGLGDVAWPRFFTALIDSGYDGAICIEVEDRAFEKTLDARKEALRRSAAFVRPFMPA